jgi:hypothetical protein
MIFQIEEIIEVIEDFWIPVLCPFILLFLLFLVIAEFRKR